MSSKYPTYTLLDYPKKGDKYGNFTGSCPSRAAKKFLTFLSNEYKVPNSSSKKALIFSIRNNKTQKEYKYVGTRVKLNRPEVVMMNNRKVNFNYKNIVTLHKDYYHNMKGGFKGLDKLSHITKGLKGSSIYDSARVGYPIKVCYSMPSSESLLGCHD